MLGSQFVYHQHELGDCSRGRDTIATITASLDHLGPLIRGRFSALQIVLLQLHSGYHPLHCNVYFQMHVLHSSESSLDSHLPTDPASMLTAHTHHSRAENACSFAVLFFSASCSL